MRLIGNLLVWISVAAGLISASSFYVWTVGNDAASDKRFVTGAQDDAPTYAQLLRTQETLDHNVIAPADAELTPKTLALLREADIDRVIVKHSGNWGAMLSNWSGKWLFLGSVVGLVAGGLMVRSGARQEIASEDSAEAPRATPEDIAGRILATISDLRGRVAAAQTEADKLDVILEMLSEVQAELVPEFVETRAVLIAKRGIGGFVRVMDAFASMERKLNRAWSAAADGHLPESLDALELTAMGADRLADVLGNSRTFG